MKGTILALLVAAVAGLLAVGNTALAHDATVPRSTEVSDCDEAITTLSRSQYLVCDDLDLSLRTRRTSQGTCDTL